MKNQPSDLEKAFKFLPLVLGIGFLMFVAVMVLGSNPDFGGVLATVLFVVPLGLGIYTLYSSTKVHKHRKSRTTLYDDSKLTDLVMKRIYEVYGIKEEQEKSLEEDDDNDNEDTSEDYLNLSQKPDTTAYSYPSFEEEQEEILFAKIFKSLNNQAVLILGVAWMFLMQVLYEKNPGWGFNNPISNAPNIITFLPPALIFIFSGLSVLFKGEFVGKRGIIVNGFFAYLYGFFMIIFGITLGATALQGKIFK